MAEPDGGDFYAARRVFFDLTCLYYSISRFHRLFLLYFIFHKLSIFCARLFW